MRVTGSRAYLRPTPTPKMPPGLVELMEGLTKDVLKHNPEHVYEFCAEHMKKLLEIRDGAPSKKPLTLEQKIKKAQEKIRQKIKHRRLQEEVDRRPNKTLEQGIDMTKTEPVIEISFESTESSKQPVHHGEHMVMAHDEMEISHEPNVIIATTDTHKQDEVFDESETVSKSTDKKSADSKEEVEETSVDIKEGFPIFSETLGNISLPNKLEEDLKRSSVDVIENELVISLARVDSNNVKEEVEEISVDIKEGLPILSDALQSKSITNKLEEDLKKSSVNVIESELLISPARVDSNNVEEEVEETTVDIKEGLPILSETNKLGEDIKRSSVDIIESELVISPTYQSDESVHEIKQEEKVLMVDVKSLTSKTPQNEEEIEMDVEIKENTSGSNTKPRSDNGHLINAQPNLNDDENTVSDPQVTLRHNLSLLDSKETLKTNELILDEIVKINSKEEIETVVVDSKTVDEEVTKNDSNDNGVIIFQQQNETLDNEILSDKLKPTQNHDIEHDVKSIDNKVITIDSENSKNESDAEQIKSNESNIETNHPESLLENQLVKTIIGEQQLSDSKPEPEAETGKPVEFVEGHKLSQELETERNETDENKNLDHVNDQVNVKHQNDYDTSKNEANIIDTVAKLLNHERQFSSELFIKENDVFLDTSIIDDDKDKIKIESDESTENQAVSGMDLETAAVTIQKVFRTFMFSKSRASTLEDTVNEDYLNDEIDKKDESEYVIPSANLNKERRTLGLSRMDTVLQTVNEEKSLSLSTDDSSTLSSAATTIQAQVRGFLVRNKLASYKTASANSLVNSEGQSTVSLEGDTNEPKKTILNIHIVPERGQFMSRDESMLTSIDLPLDNSPLSSVNLHPLGYDKSEPRKQLKREDAIQSVSPPSNNSGKLSEEIDPVKDALIENSLKPECENSHTMASKDKHQDFDAESCDTTITISSTADTVIEAETDNAKEVLSSPEHNSEAGIKDTVTNFSSDEMDVVTPFTNIAENIVSSQETLVDEKPKLVHSGEFHDMVVQTQVKRSQSSVVREFKNVLVYFLLWDK